MSDVTGPTVSLGVLTIASNPPGVLDFMSAVSGATEAGAFVEVFSDELKKLDPKEAARRAWSATSKALQGVNLE